MAALLEICSLVIKFVYCIVQILQYVFITQHELKKLIELKKGYFSPRLLSARLIFASTYFGGCKFYHISRGFIFADG